MPVNDSGTAHADSYFLTDLRLGVEDYRSGRARISPYFAIQNLFDRTYTSSVIVNAFGNRFFEPGPGRTFRVGLDIGWGS